MASNKKQRYVAPPDFDRAPPGGYRTRRVSEWRIELDAKRARFVKEHGPLKSEGIVGSSVIFYFHNGVRVEVNLPTWADTSDHKPYHNQR